MSSALVMLASVWEEETLNSASRIPHFKSCCSSSILLPVGETITPTALEGVAATLVVMLRAFDAPGKIYMRERERVEVRRG